MAKHSHNFKNSSSLKGCVYDEENKILYVTFQSGGTHSYYDCPISVFNGLKNAESAGRFFHSSIKDQFVSNKH